MKTNIAKLGEAMEDLSAAVHDCPEQQSLFPPTILVVDDEHWLRNSLRDLLQLSGYDVICAANGREAIALLGGTRFQLVLLDLNMPEVSGQDVLDFIVEREIDTSIVVLSGESTFDQATKALRKGVEDFLAKPYSPMELLRTVSKILQKRQRKSEYFLIQKRLQGSEELHRFIVNNSPDLIFMLDEHGYFSFINERSESYLGYDVDNILGKHFSEIVAEEDNQKAKHAFNQRRIVNRSTQGIELRLRMNNSDDLRHVEIWGVSIELTSMGVYAKNCDGKGSFKGTYGIARDIGDRKKSEEFLRYHQYHDLLTNLPNRALFNDRLQIALAQAKRSRRKLAVMFLDVDRFKTINDTFGHLAGDELLQSVSLKLKKCLREGDTLARVGDDEFSLLLPSISTYEDAAAIAQKILEICSQPVFHQDRELRITFSIGVAVYPDHGESTEALLRNADLAMYCVKETGRNGFRYYSGDMYQNNSNALDIEISLPRAISQNELRLFYQPQVDVAAGKVIGLEALVRWEHPERGLLLPADFIAIAEETKLICDIGDWVLKKVCKDAATLKERGYGDIRVAVNVSPQQLEMEGFDRLVIETIKRHGLDPAFLEVEITENSIMRDMITSMGVLTALSKEGITIALDDFGTGYSSLSYLQNLPLHTLKMDRSFVQNIGHAGEPNTIITAILAMAKGLKIGFIAEGVESRGQHEYLLAAGCPVAQGFYYSRPMDFKKLIPYLSARV